MSQDEIGTTTKRVVSRDDVPPKLRAKIEFQEFELIYSEFCDGDMSKGPELLHRMENEMGIAYDYEIMLKILEMLLKQSDSEQYAESIKKHLNSLQYKISEEDRDRHKELLQRVMRLAKISGIEVEDLSMPIWLKLLALSVKGLLRAIKTVGNIVVWGIIIIIAAIIGLKFGLTAAAVAFIFLGGIFLNCKE